MFAQIIIIIIAFFVISLAVIAISMLLITTPTPTPTPIPIPAPQALNTTPTRPTLTWSENIRNNKNFDMFPPCFQNDPSSKSIYGILGRVNQIQRYYNFVDILSILLCLEEIQKKSCTSQGEVKDRLTQILGMGANISDNETLTLVRAFIPIDEKNKCESDKCKLILGAVYLLERQMKVLNNDTTISKEDKSNIKGHLYTFYSTHLPTIYKLCL